MIEKTILFFVCRLLEGLQAQLGSLVEQLSMPLALLPASNLLLEAAPDLLHHQLGHLPGQACFTAAAAAVSVVVVVFFFILFRAVVDLLRCEPNSMTGQQPAITAVPSSLCFPGWLSLVLLSPTYCLVPLTPMPNSSTLYCHQYLNRIA